MSNHPSALPTIGERIRQLRSQRKPSMTQREVAERAGVSVDLIAKLEQGARQTTLLPTLHRIAGALDVDVAVLLARPQGIEPAADTNDDGGVNAIRRAITALSDEAEPVDVADLQQQARYAWMAFAANRFDALGGQLPGFITAARATAQAAPSPAVFAALSDAYNVAASMLVMLGHVDLAYLAMERAIAAGASSGDELRHAALRGRMSWMLLHQTGGAKQARRVAVEQAERVEPKMGKAAPEQLAVWAGLLVCGAVAAARAEHSEQADDLLNLAETAATRLPMAEAAGSRDHWVYEPPVAMRNEIVHGMPQVIMQQVDAAVVTGRPGRALEIAKRMPPDAGLPPIMHGRHLADVAAAQTSLRRDREATDTLLRIEREAPHWMRYQAYPRMIVRELLERERRARTPRLRALAVRLNVA